MPVEIGKLALVLSGPILRHVKPRLVSVSVGPIYVRAGLRTGEFSTVSRRD
jgi:hypothetical protein